MANQQRYTFRYQINLCIERQKLTILAIESYKQKYKYDNGTFG